MPPLPAGLEGSRITQCYAAKGTHTAVAFAQALRRIRLVLDDIGAAQGIPRGWPIRILCFTDKHGLRNIGRQSDVPKPVPLPMPLVHIHGERQVRVEAIVRVEKENPDAAFFQKTRRLLTSPGRRIALSTTSSLAAVAPPSRPESDAWKNEKTMLSMSDAKRTHRLNPEIGVFEPRRTRRAVLGRSRRGRGRGRGAGAPRKRARAKPASSSDAVSGSASSGSDSAASSE